MLVRYWALATSVSKKKAQATSKKERASLPRRERFGILLLEAEARRWQLNDPKRRSMLIMFVPYVQCLRGVSCAAPDAQIMARGATNSSEADRRRGFPDSD